jgi:cell shape-determining protein MreD
MRPGSRGPLIALVIVLVVLHFVLRVGFGLGQLAPDLLVVAVLLAARELRAGSAAALGLVLGVLDGAVIPLSLGSSALVLTVLGYLGARTRDFVATDSLGFLALYLFMGKWLFDALLYVVSGAILRPDFSSLLLISPLAAIYAAIAGVIAFAAWRQLA